jgi:hypothetical protein
MEPTANDIAAVQATLPTAPPVPAEPTPQQPPAAEPTPQPVATTPPAPTEPSDPFATMFGTEQAAPVAAPPAEPTEPLPNPQPGMPTEPTPQPTPAPETYQTYDEYMESVLSGVPQAPDAPDPDKINPDNPEEIRGFFDSLMSTAEKRIEAKIERKNAIQNAERKQWDAAFAAYPTLRSNQKVRDMVHNIRMGYFQRGKAITPTQAAKELVDSLSSSYKQGITDNQVVTTIQSVQPQGGTSTPIPTTLDRDSVMNAVQDGGEEALMQILDAEVKAGRL